MPKTELDVLHLFKYGDKADAVAYIEQVNGYMGNGNAMGSAMFNFGWGYGGLRMAVLSCGIRLEQVAPRTWQKAFSIPPRRTGRGKDSGPKETDSQWKNRLRAVAQRLFPEQEVILAVADALLIAEYGRRKEAGRL